MFVRVAGRVGARGKICFGQLSRQSWAISRLVDLEVGRFRGWAVSGLGEFH